MDKEMKVVVLAAPGAAQVEKHLARLGYVDAVIARSSTELFAAGRDATALIMMNAAYSAEVADFVRNEANSLRLIQLLTAGYEKLQHFGVPSGVQVASAGESRSPAVAELAMAMMLSLVKHLPEALRRQAEGDWDVGLRSRISGLLGKTLLIVGFGSIGKEVAVRARAFGLHVIGVTRSGTPNAAADEILASSALQSGLARADIVLITVPSSDSTRKMMGERQFAEMKPGAMLINVARGDVIDTDALVHALGDGRLAAAALDVVENEPLGAGASLWHIPNLYLTPHIGGSDGEAGHDRLAQHVAENVECLRSGRPLAYAIDI